MTAPKRQPLQVAGYLVEGGRAFVNRAFITQLSAELSVRTRNDGAHAVPLIRHAEAEAQITALEAEKARLRTTMQGHRLCEFQGLGARARQC